VFVTTGLLFATNLLQYYQPAAVHYISSTIKADQTLFVAGTRLVAVYYVLKI